MAIFISFDSFHIAYFIQPCNIPCSMQHVVSTPSTYPGSCKTCFSHIPVFGGKISLIFPIIYQIAHLHNWPTWPDQLFDLCWQLSWMTFLASLGGYFEIISHSWLLNFIKTRCASFDPFDITFKLISHAKTSLLVNCAGGTQGVQLLDWSNKGQIQAIRLRRVWVTWHPSIWCWSLWIGKSTCSCEPTLSKTEPANAKETLQAHILQALKTLFGSKFTQAGSLS